MHWDKSGKILYSCGATQHWRERPRPLVICQHIPALLTETLSVAPTVQKQFGLPSKAHSHPQLPCTGLSMSGTLCKSRGLRRYLCPLTGLAGFYHVIVLKSRRRFQFLQKNLRPRQKQQRAPGGQYGLEQAARQPGGERHDEKQQCQDQNKPGQPEAVVSGRDFFALHGQTSLCIRALRHPMPGCADCVRAQNVVHCYRQITEELLC